MPRGLRPSSDFAKAWMPAETESMMSTTRKAMIYELIENQNQVLGVRAIECQCLLKV